MTKETKTDKKKQQCRPWQGRAIAHLQQLFAHTVRLKFPSMFLVLLRVQGQ